MTASSQSDLPAEHSLNFLELKRHNVLLIHTVGWYVGLDRGAYVGQRGIDLGLDKFV